MRERIGPSRYPMPISEARSRIMRAIKGKGNSTTEEALASRLRREHLSGWRRHTDLPGRPDFVWHRRRVAVFVDGCFWHGCPRCYRAPRHNAQFWRAKIDANKRRDMRVSRVLRAAGWQVVRIWECRVQEARSITRLRTALDL